MAIGFVAGLAKAASLGFTRRLPYRHFFLRDGNGRRRN